MHGHIGTAHPVSALSDAQLIAQMLRSAPPHVSKHRQFDKDGWHIRGRCFIAENSSIKKRMRAERRGEQGFKPVKVAA